MLEYIENISQTKFYNLITIAYAQGFFKSFFLLLLSNNFLQKC